VDDVLSDAQKIGVRCLVFPLGESETTTCCPGEVAFADVPVIDQQSVVSVSLRTSLSRLHRSWFVLGRQCLQPDPGHRSGLEENVGRSVWIFWLLSRACWVPGCYFASIFTHVRFRTYCLCSILFGSCRGGNWDSGHRRACFIIDDPSLYRPSYSYVHFQQIAAMPKSTGIMSPSRRLRWTLGGFITR